MWKKWIVFLLAIVFVVGTAQAAFAYGTSWLKEEKGSLWQSLGLDPATVQQELKDGKSMKDIAEEQGLSKDELMQKMIDAAQKNLAQMVQEGKITQEQSDAKLKALTSRISQWLEQSGAQHIFRDGFRHGQHHFSFNHNEALANLLGMTSDALKQELASGKSLAQLAEDKGISVDSLHAFLVDQMKEKLSALVASGRLTKDEMDEKLAQFEAHVTNIINQTCNPSSTSKHEHTFKQTSPPSNPSGTPQLSPSSFPKDKQKQFNRLQRTIGQTI